MSAYSHRGHVYFAAVDRYVKIGFSSQPVGVRLDRLLTGTRLICPDDLDRSRPIDLIDYIPGCVMRDERRLHGLFAAHRTVGEWFHFTEAFCDQLDAMQYVTYAEGLLHFRRARKTLGRSLAVAA